MALSPWSSSDLYRGPAALSPGAIRRKTGQDGLPHGVSLTVFRSLGELNGENRGKNPENTGENVLEPVVGIEPTTYGLRIQSSIRANNKFKIRKFTLELGFSSVWVEEPLWCQDTI